MSTVEVIPEADVVVLPAQDNVLVTIEVGQVGLPGLPGPPGPPSEVPGPPGAPGPPGHTIRYGTTDPTPATGYDGDFYINTATNFLFGPKEVGTWPPGTSLVGPPGTPGNTVLYGPSDPIAAQGVDGNFYINTTSHFMFGPKAAGAWPAGVSLVGPQGPKGDQGIQGPIGPQGVPGNTVLYGAGPPSSVSGVDGNFYINTSNNFIHGPKAGGNWPPGVSLVGPVGPMGPQGIAGVTTCIVSDSPPVGAADNVLWWESDTGLFYINFNDGSSTQWVIACPTPDTSMFVSVETQSFTSLERTQARTNIYAAPFDALAYNGMQLNGSMDVAQEANVNFPCDEWIISIGDGTTVKGTGTQVADGPPGINNSVRLKTTVATPVLTATDQAFLYQNLEGQQFARMMWGTPLAVPLTVAFFSKVHRPGTYSVSVGSDDQSRMYVTTFTHNVADAWEFKTVTIPGCKDGQWKPASSARGLFITFTMAAGANRSGAPNSWLTSDGSKPTYGATGATNGLSALSDTFQISGVVFLPGVEAPREDRLPFIMRPPQQELLLCQRHLQFIPGGRCTGQASTAGQMLLSAVLWTPMRPSPKYTLLKTSFSAGVYDVLVAGNWVTAASASLAGATGGTPTDARFSITGFTGMTIGGAVTFNAGGNILRLDSR